MIQKIIKVRYHCSKETEIALEKLLFFECDISQDDSVKKAILGVIQRFEQIDGLINNAYFMEGYGAMPKTSEF